MREMGAVGWLQRRCSRRGGCKWGVRWRVVEAGDERSMGLDGPTLVDTDVQRLVKATRPPRDGRR